MKQVAVKIFGLKMFDYESNKPDGFQNIKDKYGI